MIKKLIGHCGVDSGMIMIIDPCYLHDIHRYKKLLPGMIKRNEADPDKQFYENSKRFHKAKQEAINITEDWKLLCKDQDKNSEPKEYANGVLSHTKNGDGSFPVYAYFDKDNNVCKLEIVF